jgi:hypothetical protein
VFIFGIDQILVEAFDPRFRRLGWNCCVNKQHQIADERKSI